MAEKEAVLETTPDENVNAAVPEVDHSEPSGSTKSEIPFNKGKAKNLPPDVDPIKHLEASVWIKNLLEDHYSHKEAEASLNEHDHDDLSLRGSKSRIKIQLLEHEVAKIDSSNEACRMAVLSTMMTLKVKFLVVGDVEAEERVEFFIIKTPPQCEEDREFAGIANVLRREVYFYTEAVPLMLKWVKSQNVDMSFSVPNCYLAKVYRSLSRKPVADILENFYNAESILILEDLRPLGFGKRHYVEGLSVLEVKAAIYELAKIHATTWVMHEKCKMDLDKGFKLSLKPLESAVLYDMFVTDGIQTYKEYLATEVGREKKDVINRLSLLETKLHGVLVDLFEPSPRPAPTCLIHMDSWTDNLMFRVKSIKAPAFEEDPNAQDLRVKDRIEDSPLECRIIDWQLMSLGRPTHDLALLFITSLSPDDRENYTDLLLSYYYQIFQETAALFQQTLPFDLDCIREQYQASKLLAVFFVFGSIELVLPEYLTRERLEVALNELISEKLV